MKKFSDLIKEQESSKEYKYTATVKVEGKVVAASEGDAGELVDKEMDTIPGMITYEIDNIIDVTKSIGENKINEHATPEMREFENAFNGMLDALKASGIPYEVVEELTNVYREFESKVESILNLNEENEYAPLKNLSSEKLDFKEFNEYIKDYTVNPGEYNIETDSEYYDALVLAVQNPHKAYEEYSKLYN